MRWSEDDEAAIRRVLALAETGRGSAPPNPLVGAVLVKDGMVLGEAFHRAPGEPHAEMLALAQAGKAARGSTLYINLEPCCHQGRTAPCAPQLVAGGVAEVVIGLSDPDPRVSGGGIALLQEAGVRVRPTPPEWTERCLEQNRDFVHSTLHKRPFVTWKYAMTLDGRLATASGDSRWVTGPAARAVVHGERAWHQAVLVGSGTVLADDPALNVRGVSGARQPLRIILDRRGRTPAHARIFESAGGPVWIGYGELAENAWKERMRGVGAELFPVSDLSSALEYLCAQGVRSLLLESGPELATAFMSESCIQRVLVHVAPKWVGGSAAPGPLGGAGVDRMSDAWTLSRPVWRQLEEDLLLEGELDSRWRRWESWE